MRTQADIGARGGKAPCRAACGPGGEVCFPSAPAVQGGEGCPEPGTAGVIEDEQRAGSRAGECLPRKDWLPWKPPDSLRAVGQGLISPKP